LLWQEEGAGRVKGEEGGEVPEGIKGHSATEKNGANSKVSKPWHVRTYEFCAQGKS
jgi:hypothetical protein